MILVNTTKAAAFPSDVTYVCNGVTHHVQNISNKSCTEPIVGTLKFSDSSEVTFNDSGTCEFGHLYVIGKARTTFWYYYGPNMPGIGGLVQLKKAVGCWQVTIGGNANYVTVTN